MPPTKRELPAVGWREWILLPELCPTPLKAKVDTGAHTSSLHAFGLQLCERPDGVTVASFEIHPAQRSASPSFTVESPVVAFKDVRSSSGHRERRPVIETAVELGPHRFTIALTLTARDAMGFRMLLGRAALRRRFLVDPGRSYRQGVVP
ncbi:MAG: RimK/LysX family protein [Actinomycetota bacterium]